jgi:hypothetical protein
MRPQANLSPLYHFSDQSSTYARSNLFVSLSTPLVYDAYGYVFDSGDATEEIDSEGTQMCLLQKGQDLDVY